MIRLLVVEDHPIVASGTAAILSGTGNVEVGGIQADIAGAVATVQRTPVDIILSDVMLGKVPAGLELPAALRGVSSTVPVVFFSSYDTPWFQARALQSGAAGYLLKTDPLERVVAALEHVVRGDLVFPAAVIHGRPRSHRAPTPREREILLLLARGLGNGEIGATLGISPRTVESHLARLFARYNVTSRTHLVMVAVGQGWMTASPQGESLEQ